MNIIDTPIAGVSLVETVSFDDERGSFFRAFCEEELASILCGRHIVQANISRTERVGAVRGLHCQRAPHAEMKLIRCLKGRVWDVAVDLRAGSPSFMRSFGVELSPKNRRMMVLSEGFAHGFQVLEEGSELLYLHTRSYAPASELGLRFDDPALSIAWPLPVTDISERDSQHPLVGSGFGGIVI